MQGYIKLFRKFTEWEWYSDINTKILFLHCLLMANHKIKMWRGIEVERGSFFTSVNHLTTEIGLTEKQIRLSLDKLKKTGELSLKTTNKGTCISVCNYDKYQKIELGRGQTERQTERQTKSNTEGKQAGKQRATNNNNKNELKNDKNLKEDKKDIRGKTSRFSAPSKTDIVDFFISDKTINEDDSDYYAERFLQFYESKGWMVGKNKMTNWKTAATRSLDWEDKRAKSANKNNSGAGTHIESWQDKAFKQTQKLTLD